MIYKHIQALSIILYAFFELTFLILMNEFKMFIGKIYEISKE